MLNCIARIVCLNTGTTTGANLRRIWLETGVSPFQSTCEKVVANLFYHKTHHHEMFKIDVIKELTDVKYGICQNNLDREQTKDIIYDLCCH